MVLQGRRLAAGIFLQHFARVQHCCFVSVEIPRFQAYCGPFTLAVLVLTLPVVMILRFVLKNAVSLGQATSTCN